MKTLKDLREEKKRLRQQGMPVPRRMHEKTMQLEREIARLSKSVPAVLDSEDESEDSDDDEWHK